MNNPFFTRKEFSCHCGCGFDVVDAELLARLTQLREHFCSPVIINSGCRCPQHNQKIGGSPNSQHMLGKAADIVVRGTHPSIVWDYLQCHYETTYGLGLYDNFVHFDVREAKARWGT